MNADVPTGGEPPVCGVSLYRSDVGRIRLRAGFSQHRSPTVKNANGYLQEAAVTSATRSSHTHHALP